jgi:type IV pilus assembly protein PilA
LFSAGRTTAELNPLIEGANEMMKKVQKGFTLIELMIVVAIIGILAAIAIPAYQDYTIRAQASEGLAMASATKAAVAEFFADRGAWPTDAGAGGGQLGWTAPPSGKYVASIAVNGGNIIITYGGQANGAIAGDQVVLRPGATANGDVIWVCQAAPVPGAVAPNPAPTMAAAVAPAPAIDGKFLPANCRP